MNKKLKIVIGIVVVIAIVLIGYLASTSVLKQTTTETIKIGLSLPLTGEAASWGDNLLAGARLAQKEINETGGIRGRNLEIIAEDDRCDSASGASVLNKLITINNVDAITGFVCSGVAGASLPIAQNNKVPTIISAASASHLTIDRDFVFRIYPSDPLQGGFGADFIYNKLGKKKIAIIYINNDYGQGIKNAFVDKFKKLGGEIVYEEGVLQGSSDLRTQMSKVKQSGAEALYFPVYPDNAISGYKQARELQLNIPIVGADALNGEEVIKSGLTEGMIYIVPKINTPEDFIKKIKALPGRENLQVSLAASLGYDSIKVLASAINDYGVDSESIKEGLKEIYYNSSISVPTIEFDNQGDLKEAVFEVKIVKDKEGVDLE